MIEKIVAKKREEVKAVRGIRLPLRQKPVIPFTLKGPRSIIAELKRRSPSAGAIGEVDDERIGAYSRYGSAISVLTDRSFFGGSFEFMSEVAAKSPLPILCKDFVIDEAQIDLAYAMGADMVLLIVRILGRERLQALHAHAAGLGMTCLVEVHKERELDEISGLDLPMVGVNARDLDTLAIDLEGAARILSSVNARIRVAESGIKSCRDMERFKGTHAFLVGETLMRASDLEATFMELLYG